MTSAGRGKWHSVKCVFLKKYQFIVVSSLQGLKSINIAQAYRQVCIARLARHR